MTTAPIVEVDVFGSVGRAEKSLCSSVDLPDVARRRPKQPRTTADNFFADRLAARTS